MQNYKYVNQKEYQPVKNDLINLIHLVQNEIRDKFTFSYEFIGSASRNINTEPIPCEASPAIDPAI